MNESRGLGVPQQSNQEKETETTEYTMSFDKHLRSHSWNAFIFF